MAISYKKLWKLLIDKDIKKKDLVQMAGWARSSNKYSLGKKSSLLIRIRSASLKLSARP